MKKTTKTRKTKLPRILWGHGNDFNNAIRSGRITSLETRLLIAAIQDATDAYNLLLTAATALHDQGGVFRILSFPLTAKAKDLSTWIRTAQAMKARMPEAEPEEKAS